MTEDLSSGPLEVSKPTNDIICEELLQLLQSCCVVDPAARPSISELAYRLEEMEIYGGHSTL
jgi:hypothetical protein